MKRWVVKTEGGLEIVATSGFEPPLSLCEAKDDWTIYNISYNEEEKVVFYDPERQMREDQARAKEEKRRKVEEFKVEFIADVSHKLLLLRKGLPYAIGVAIGYGLAKLLH